MIELGICTSAENAAALAGIGYDYIELSLSATAAQNEEDFARTRACLGRAGILCRAMNGMLPGTLPVVGPRADLDGVKAYLEGAFRRAEQLGARVIVFGSGGSRAVPAGYSRADAWRQLGEYLALADRLAGLFGLRIAIEPLRREECNILNYVSEAVELASHLELPHVGVLGDTYHMSMGGEPLAVLGGARGLLTHIHIARPEGRAYPAPGDAAGLRGEYRELFRVLEGAGYAGMMSIEGSTEDFAHDAQASFALLDGLRREFGA